MPLMKRVYRDKQSWSTGQQPGTKSARGPADEPQIHCGSTSCFVAAFPACHEKGLQGQKSVVPPFGSQEQSALLVPADKPLINRWSTAEFVPPSVYIGFRQFVILERR